MVLLINPVKTNSDFVELRGLFNVTFPEPITFVEYRVQYPVNEFPPLPR